MLKNKIFDIGNKTIAISLLGLNFYFLPVSLTILINKGGTWGIGYIILPVTLIINLFIITALLSLKKRSWFLLIANAFGLVFALVFLYHVLTLPTLN